jgi:hypothetical protein
MFLLFIWTFSVYVELIAPTPLQHRRFVCLHQHGLSDRCRPVSAGELHPCRRYAGPGNPGCPLRKLFVTSFLRFHPLTQCPFQLLQSFLRSPPACPRSCHPFSPAFPPVYPLLLPASPLSSTAKPRLAPPQPPPALALLAVAEVLLVSLPVSSLLEVLSCWVSSAVGFSFSEHPRTIFP